ncbi:MAG: tetratricopeptide repeat protein [Deltaproteobacteria bacterium]
MLRTKALPLLVFGGVMHVAGAANAQDIDGAIQAYNSDKHEDAAFLFYDVMENSDDPDAKVKAEYYLAHSLYKAGYLLPAYQFYGEVFNQGEDHPYFLKATEGLLNVADEIGDDTLIPEVINKGYSQAFARLKAEQLNSINYMIGMISQRRGDYQEAKQFLEAVTSSSPYYIKARYLLAIMAVKTATEQGAEDYGEAIKHFSEIEESLATATDDSKKKLYRLALLGKARAYFSQGSFQESVNYYEKVPRFSEDWYDAMFESGWAYYQNAQFGKALGMVHSIQSPYFDDRYRAESFVLKATTYFQMCHFDRVRKALDDFFALYEPMSEKLKPWLDGDQTDAEMVELVVDGNDKFPSEIRLQLSNNRRFQKFLSQVREVDAELGKAKSQFPEGGFKAQLIGLLEDQREQRVALTGKLVRDQLRREAVFLDDFLNQARIIKFETADAERKMLEAGKDITKGPRAKGPRPIVPNAKYQYWAFLGEYWIDELGYYEHSIKDECIEAVFQ